MNQLYFKQYAKKSFSLCDFIGSKPIIPPSLVNNRKRGHDATTDERSSLPPTFHIDTPVLLSYFHPCRPHPTTHIVQKHDRLELFIGQSLLWRWRQIVCVQRNCLFRFWFIHEFMPGPLNTLTYCRKTMDSSLIERQYTRLFTQYVQDVLNTIIPPRN